MEYFMGIDIGTFESKGVLIDADARVVAYQTCPHVMEAPQPGYAEHDAEGVWWHDFCTISRALIAESGVDPKAIEAVAPSGIGPCCLPVDEELRPLRKGILYGIDVRAAKEIEALNAQIGPDAILDRYGSPLTTQSAGAKILWIKNNEPDIYARTAKILTCSSYLAGKLTGVCSIDRYTAARSSPSIPSRMRIGKRTCAASAAATSSPTVTGPTKSSAQCTSRPRARPVWRWARR